MYQPDNIKITIMLTKKNKYIISLCIQSEREKEKGTWCTGEKETVLESRSTRGHELTELVRGVRLGRERNKG